jgi:hypothetical protein
MKMGGQLAHFESSAEPRGALRRKLRFDVQRVVTPGGPADVIIHDVSETGFLIETTSQLTNGEAIELELPHAGSSSAEVVWRSGDFFGCRFERPISRAAVSATLLRAPAEHPPETVLAGSEVADLKDAGFAPQPDEGAGSAELSVQAKSWTILSLAALSWALVGGVATLLMQ